jgi:hypothetical protein
MSELMFKPEYGRLRAFEGMSTRLVRSRNHHDGDAKMARRFDLCVGRRPARVFGDEHFDLLAREKRRFRFSVEGTTIVKQPDIGRQRDVTRRIDGAGDVVMMGRARESTELKAAKREKNATGFWSQRIGGSFGARDGKPVVARLGFPGGAHDRGERDRKPCAGRDRVGGDLIGVRMRCVNDRLRCVLLKPRGETVGAAEAADPGSHRLRFGVRGAPGKRNRRVEAGVSRQQARQLRGLGGTSKDENAHREHLHEC